ncbi:MAG: hypothetical protein AAGG50_13305 [Bacteroidota bacterium]
MSTDNADRISALLTQVGIPPRAATPVQRAAADVLLATLAEREVWLTTSEAARYLGCSARHLRATIYVADRPKNGGAGLIERRQRGGSAPDEYLRASLDAWKKAQLR